MRLDLRKLLSCLLVNPVQLTGCELSCLSAIFTHLNFPLSVILSGELVLWLHLVLRSAKCSWNSDELRVIPL